MSNFNVSVATCSTSAVVEPQLENLLMGKTCHLQSEEELKMEA